MDETTKDELIRAIQKIAQEAGNSSVLRHECLRKTGLSERKVMLLFGSYNALVEAAGLQPFLFPSSEAPKYSDEELLAELVRVLRLPDSKLTRIFFEQQSGGRASVTERRFGGWVNALRSVLPLLDASKDGRLIERIREYVSPQTPPRSRSEPAETFPIEEPDSEPEAQEPEYAGHGFIPSGSNVYGDFINFRGLQHAPVNEQGGVFLFGMICRELGYVVEIVKPGFPGCEAKRRIRGKPGMWQRVRIEFEFQSRSFRSHGHDPDQCDVIVCWEDNWPDCPVEVLELRSALRSLPSDVGG